LLFESILLDFNDFAGQEGAFSAKVENKQSGNHSMELKVEQSSIRAPLVIKSGASFSTKLLILQYENSRVIGGECVGTFEAHPV
jgi:hypothetical protein